MSYGGWTEEEDAALRRMWRAGESVKAIARELERHPDVRHVRYRRRRLDLPRRRYRTGERARLQVSVPMTVKEALESRLSGTGLAISTHVRALILRDLGISR